ncbi:amidohydrolase family protein [Novosphingobium panipatense]|uniref:Predicted amidohydrolase YtcJ n=2 Tax=Novosphingobium panipatense TaxID=428991 RepID=A0ABY1Q477_9SPHN|nr:amidohydrolase family protein [Novosphingobium panipatense]SMP56585.1 Predicted amidohydrolase YtcJ [Novosphingobium panipatense]
MLIRNAQLWQSCLSDVRIQNGRVAEIGTLEPRWGERLIDGGGGLLIPGLHDNHIHLAALSAQQSSIMCGPPAVSNAAELARALDKPGDGWLRGTGFHECVMDGKLPDARVLDGMIAHRPFRMQHRTGRMWFLNTPALAELLAKAAPPPGLEHDGERFTGRLFDEDDWLRRGLQSVPPDFEESSKRLARFGVTGITDMSPRNDPQMARHFAEQKSAGRLLQSVILAGAPSLAEGVLEACQLGPLKLHLHENALPDFDDAVALVQTARAQGRSVAVHCVTEVELVFTAALLEVAGSRRGDRIEHASVVPEVLIPRLRHLQLDLCVQPHFITERGDSYLANMPPRQMPDMYRLRSLMSAAIPLCGGSDAPYGDPDPWKSMAAAVTRTTLAGAMIGEEECLSPEEALALYLVDPREISRQRQIVPGAAADLCLLDRPWAEVRRRLCSDDVRLTIAAGKIIHDRVDQSPCEGRACADTPA